MTPKSHYWKANDHQWGPGHVHVIGPDGTKTLCGVKLENCPGQCVSAIESNAYCRGCARVITAQRERTLRQEQWKREQEERERRQQEIQKEREKLRTTLVNRWEPRQVPCPIPSGFAMPFGKYKGKNLADIPENYLEWLLTQDWLFDDLRINIEDYLGIEGE